MTMFCIVDIIKMFVIGGLWLGWGMGVVGEELQLRDQELPAVSVVEREREVVMENGLVMVRLDKGSGNLTLIQSMKGEEVVTLAAGRKAMYFDANTRMYLNPTSGGDVQVLEAGEDVGEIAIRTLANVKQAFTTTVYYRMHRGVRGFYAYVVYEHGVGDAGVGLGQTRFVIRGVGGDKLFTHHYMDERSYLVPTAGIDEKVSDATYRLKDGRVYTKYDNAVYEGEHKLHGAVGKGSGLWMIYPSNEFLGGGPVKQNLSVHMDDAMHDHVILGMLHSGHYNSGGIRLGRDEVWEMMMGPVFVYVNHDKKREVMHADAKQVAERERGAWPYVWLKHKAFAVERGVVKGKVKRMDGGSANGAWAVLVPAGENWWETSKGYHFWSKVGADGEFEIGKVRDGVYRLFLSGANSFDDYQQDDVVVKAGEVTRLGEVVWSPRVFGERLWEIGVADRTSHEFMDGDNYRHWANYERYVAVFKNDVTFTIGESDEKKDWNYAHWTIYNKNPKWVIRFKVEKAMKGRGVLTIGITSAQPSRGRTTALNVAVNGKVNHIIRLGKTGTAGYRSGSQDSVYHVRRAVFDASELKVGWNEITLWHEGTVKVEADGRWRRRVGHVMYDAIRLEVGEE